MPGPGPGTDTQGGGLRGGPRRWTGNGPRPARHIPWPELFKHHQSVLTGHLKMMDMVRKHCAEGSGNYKTAQACVDRTHEMLRSFKQTVNSFVPPRDNIDRVPLGASSASMYPGYSPADHIYGEAAAEFGALVAQAKREGREIKTDSEGLEYIVGQSSESAREQIEAIKKEKEDASAHITAGSSPNVKSSAQSECVEGEPMEDVQETGDHAGLFVIDSNPTAVDHLTGKSTAIRSKNKANSQAKRRISLQDEQQSHKPAADEHQKKKVKASEAIEKAAKVESPALKDEFEEAVEARHKQREEKRKKRSKDEKKRKRESDSSQIVPSKPVNASENVIMLAEESTVQKPTKKKHKKDKAVVEAAQSAKDIYVKTEKKEKKIRPSNDSASADAEIPMDSDVKQKKKKLKKASD